MQATDVMVRNVVTVRPDTAVAEAVRKLVDHDISALPVVNDEGHIVGIISEADLMHRTEIATEHRRRRWTESLVGASTLAEEFARSHGSRVSEVMTRDVITVREDTAISEIASLLERNRIKRVPAVRDGRVVGIVSRANLIQALASVVGRGEMAESTDQWIREELLSRLEEQPWTDFGDRNITVHDGIVHIWGRVGSEAERTALVALAEQVSGVARVPDEMIAAY
jgi:CBS domain-containing protein